MQSYFLAIVELTPIQNQLVFVWMRDEGEVEAARGGIHSALGDFESLFLIFFNLRNDTFDVFLRVY